MTSFTFSNLNNEPPDELIVHYASPYYDPVKAHKYYMEHRKLKGRRRAALSDEGKEVWDYTKASIQNEKKEVTTKVSEAQQSDISQLRESARQKCEEITAKLQRVQKLLSSKKFRKAKVWTAAKRRAARESAARERREISNSLNAAIEATREAYTQYKSGLNDSYEELFESEYNKILAEYPKPVKTKKKKKEVAGDK